MIVQASLEDTDEILDVINLSNQQAFKKIIPKEYFQEPVLTHEDLMQEFSKISFYVYRFQNKIVGVTGLEIGNAEKGAVRWVYIHPEYKNKGIGTALLSHIEKIAINANLKKLQLRTEEKAYWAISFYRNRGFSIIGKIEVPWGFNVLMEKPLLYQ